MSLFRILGGVALGVGAVAAAPFTGGGSILGAATLAGSLAGAGTAAAAVGVGAAGGIVGAALNEMDEKEKEEEKKYAFKRGMKKGEEETKKKIEQILTDYKRRDFFLLASVAIGICFANCDGYISEEEEYEINYFVGETLKNPNIPEQVKNQVKRIYEKKETFSLIEYYLDKLNMKELKVLDEMIEGVIMADGKETKEETSLRKVWLKYFERRKDLC